MSVNRDKETTSTSPVSQMLAEAGLNTRRAQAPAEVARQRQAVELGLDGTAVNVQRTPPPGEVHRGVQDEALAERMTLYQVTFYP